MKNIFFSFLIVFISGTYFAQNKSSNPDVEYDSIIQEKFFLTILDTTNAVNSPKKFPLDENDCYLQVHGKYAVLSYRFRGKNEFISGNIYQTGKVLLPNSKEYQTISFQGDNHFDASNQGKRFYLAYRFLDVEERKMELIQCTNTFTPSRFFTAHTASEIEKKRLIERSKQQNSVDGF
jgi:hypothetical protein